MLLAGRQGEGEGMAGIPTHAPTHPRMCWLTRYAVKYSVRVVNSFIFYVFRASDIYLFVLVSLVRVEPLEPPRADDF